MILVPISPGELLDKITILAIKLRRIDDPMKRANVAREFDLLEAVKLREITDAPGLADLFARLEAVNEKLWDVEDDLRDLDSRQTFDATFVALARSVYVMNDERARIKKAINLLLGSAIIEEKSYKDHAGAQAKTA
jgi:hypothetical protein